jgi:class 3 adenylate cyclase
MADLRLIKELHRKYRDDSPFHSVDFDKTTRIDEAIDPNRIEKALPNKVAELGPLYTLYFDLGIPTNLALLFIDVCSFSTKYQDINDEELVEYLDSYYEIILPIIHKHGGEVDKIMGDGIICLFGAPFLEDDLKRNIELAYECSKEIIKETIGSGYESKIALHAGEIKYYKNSSINYEEYTIVGKIMTELFRLESISEDGKINFYSTTEVDEYISERFSRRAAASRISTFSKFKNSWTLSGNQIISPGLKGVTYGNYKTITLNRIK